MRLKHFFTAVVLLSVFLFMDSLYAQQHQWKEKVTGTSVNLLSISAPKEDVAWIAGPNGTVFLKDDDCNHWDNVSISCGVDLWSIYAFNAKKALVIGYDSNYINNHTTAVYRTINGGRTWQKVLQSQPEGHFNAMTFFNNKDGILYGNPVLSDVVGMFWEIYKTADGGATWTPTENPPPQLGNNLGWNNAMTHVGCNTVYFGTTLFDNFFNFGANARIYKSTDRGETWTYSTTPGVVQAGSIHFKNSMTGYASGAKTTNGGATWVHMNDPYGGTINNFIHTSTGVCNKIWVTGILRNGPNYINDTWVNAAQVYYSEDGGETWTLDYTSTSGTPNEVNISGNCGDEKVLYLIKTNGKIVKKSLEEDDSFVIQNNNYIFDLMPNYPNPFNPTTTIKYQIPTSGFVTLRIYDMLGRELTTLVNEVKTEGIHQVQWNASGFPSGTYFYKLLSGNYTDIKRMTLIK